MQQAHVRARKVARPVVRALLQDATMDVHLRLHGAASFAALAEGRLDREGYADLLGRLLRFHAAVRASTTRARGLLGLTDDADRRVELLREDLTKLGVPPAPPALPLPLPPWSDAETGGCLYVVEGASLGGKLIFRQLDYLLESDAGRGFFRGAGDDALRWRRLCAALEAHGAEEQRLAAMARGATAAFALFEACLDGVQ